MSDELSMERVEKERGVALEERVFTVGEVVEYWEGAFVRGRRIGSGEPAFVKRVEGNGQYAIKMVGASRGKFRMCGWESLFKDGSFNKNVARRDGARVRGDARRREMAKEEAEAKFGDELRQTKLQLKQIEKRNKEKEKEREDRQKRDEIVTRTADREREKSERERIAKHKRQVEELNNELEQDREEECRDTRQLIRELRQDLKLKGEELNVAKEGSVTLQDEIGKEQRQTEKYKKACETWQARHTGLFHTQGDNGARIITLEGEVRNKTRECVALQRILDTTCSAHVEERSKRDLQDQVSSPFLYVFLFLLFVVSNILSYFSQVHEKYQKKLETSNDNEKTQRKEAEMEAGVATALVLVVHGQRQLAEEKLQVWVWVRAHAKDSKTIRDRTQQRAQQYK
jgi:hypothetical protein